MDGTELENHPGLEDSSPLLAVMMPFCSLSFAYLR